MNKNSIKKLENENAFNGDWTCYKPLNELKYFRKFYKEK